MSRIIRAPWLRRPRALVRLGAGYLGRSRAALRFTGLLAVVSLVLLSPLLIDDLAFRTSYLLRPSPDAVTITTPTLLSEHPRLTLLKGTLSVPPTLSGKARTVESIAALVKGGSARLALKAPVFQVELSPGAPEDRGQTVETAIKSIVSPLLQALDLAAFETLTIRDGALVVVAGTRRFLLDDFSADVTVKRKTAMRIKGSFGYLGETVAFDTTLGASIERRGSIRMPLKAFVQSGLFTAAVDGRIDVGGSPLMLIGQTVDIQIPNVRGIARWLGQPWPTGRGLKNLSIVGSLDWSGRRLSIPKGEFGMDGNSASGALNLTLGDVRPAVSGTLALDALDLTPYVVGESQEPETSWLGQFKVARDLTLPLLGLIDCDVRLSAEKITLGSIQAQTGAASLSLREGQMLLTVVDVGFKDSRMHGEIAIEGSATTPNYRVRGGFKNGDMSEATMALVGTALLRGRGDVDVDLTASGSAGIDVLSKLNGKIKMVLPDGGAAGCSLKGLIVAADAAEQDVSHPCQSYTSVGPVKAEATLTSGIVKIDHFDTGAGLDPLRLSGTVDLVTRIMDVTVSSNPPAPDQPRDLVTVRGRPETPTYGRRKKPE